MTAGSSGLTLRKLNVVLLPRVNPVSPELDYITYIIYCLSRQTLLIGGGMKRAMVGLFHQARNTMYIRIHATYYRWYIICRCAN